MKSDCFSKLAAFARQASLANLLRQCRLRQFEMANSNATGNKLACFWLIIWEHVHFCSRAASTKSSFLLRSCNDNCEAVRTCTQHFIALNGILRIAIMDFPHYVMNVDTLLKFVSCHLSKWVLRWLGIKLPLQAGLVRSSVHTQWQRPKAQARL